MFRPTDRQTSLFECRYLVPDKKRERLEKSWAHAFRTRVMPHIDEELFRDAFCANNGRPNFSIRLLTGAHLLKEAFDLTDEDTVEAVEFNLQWHFALGLTPEQAHIVRRTMHSYRVKLTENDRAQRMFADLTGKLATAEGVRLGRQRLDSTHVLSNIALLTRLGLFCETVEHFMRALRKELPDRIEGLDRRFRARYLDREGYFADVKKEQARRRLPVVAVDVYDLVRTFDGDAAVRSLKAFGLLRRLFEEQCEVVDGGGDDVDRDGDAGDGERERGVGEPKVKLREAKTVSSASLQSPHDPDATYGHKGKGYEVQIAETCDENNPLQLITGVAVNGANESDQAALVPMVDQLAESDLAPTELLADTGYGSGRNIVECAERGIDLQAPVRDPAAPPAVDAFITAGEPDRGVPTAAAAAEPPTDVAADAAAAEPATDAAAEAAAAEPPTDVASDAAATEPVPDAAPETASLAGDGVRGQRVDRLDLAAFAFNAAFNEVLACPDGPAPAAQHVANGVLIATFAAAQCHGCSLSMLCPTRELADGSRQLRRAPATIATEVRQHEQRTRGFKDRYRTRSGVESTNSTLKGRHGLGKLRVRGKPRVDVAALLKTLSLNARRVVQHHVTLWQQPPEPCPG